MKKEILLYTKRWEKADQFAKKHPCDDLANQQEVKAWNELSEVRRKAFYAKLEELAERKRKW